MGRSELKGMDMKILVEKYWNFLDNKKPQTTNKIKYVTNYVQRWLYVLGNANFAEGINFIDCMCNAGIYRDGDYCTCIQVLKLFIQSAAIHTDKSFHLYLNDYDSHRIESLKEVIASVYKGDLQNLHIHISQKDVNEYLKLLMIEKTKFLYHQGTLLFVDPYDFGTVHIPTLRKFCEQYYCELLFNLFTSDWVRNRNNEMDARIDSVIDNGDVQINNKRELVNYIIDQLKVGSMSYSFNYEFHTEKNTELYQIIYLTPKDKGLGVLKEALWATFNGAAYYRNPRKVSANQLSLITAEMEEKIALDTEQYIISCNVEEARRIILSLPQKTHLAYKDIALPILERTMLKNGHLKKHIFQAFIKVGIVRKLNEHVRKNNFIDDFYDIIG